MSDTSRTGRLLLATARRAARSYDGTEAASDRLIAAGAAYEDFVRKTVEAKGGDWVQQSEKDWAAAAARRETAAEEIGRTVLGARRSLGITELVDTALQLERNLAAKRVTLPVQDAELCLLPTNGRQPIQAGSGRGFDKPRLDPRTERLVLALHRGGVSIDDMAIHKGRPQPGAMRGEAYTLIQIPRYNREVLVCDEVGQASFVSVGIRGPLFFATYGKEHLGRFPDIYRVENRNGRAEEEIVRLVLNDNPPQAKTTIDRRARPPLSNDIVLIHGLRFAEAYHQATETYKLPGDRDGAVSGLSGEFWKNWNYSYIDGTRGVGTDGISGVNSLFRAHGLTAGKKCNPEAVAEAIATLNRTGHHGLTRGADDEGRLTYDLLLNHALLDSERLGHLPYQKDGAISGVAGENYKSTDHAMRIQGRGLTDPKIKGWNDLYKAYGLRFMHTDNPEAIAMGLHNIMQTGHHGLRRRSPAEQAWSEPLILTHALWHWRDSEPRRLPNESAGPVKTVPGQHWSSVQVLLRKPFGQLRRAGLRGLVHFFQVAGLLDEQGRPRPDVIEPALERLKRTGDHGLVLPPVEATPPLPPLKRGPPRKLPKMQVSG